MICLKVFGGALYLWQLLGITFYFEPDRIKIFQNCSKSGIGCEESSFYLYIFGIKISVRLKFQVRILMDFMNRFLV